MGELKKVICTNTFQNINFSNIDFLKITKEFVRQPPKLSQKSSQTICRSIRQHRSHISLHLEKCPVERVL